MWNYNLCWASRRFAWLAIAAVLGVAVSVLAAAPPRRARPPQFSSQDLEVFLPDARVALVGTPRVRHAAAPPVDAPRPGVSPTADHSPWSELVSAEVLEDEIKSQQVALAAAVSNATKFKSGEYQTARERFHLLAALFGIVADYDKTVRWRREAPALREAMSKAAVDCQVASDATFREASARNEDLQSLIRGESVSLPKIVNESLRVASRESLMARLQVAHDERLAAWSSDANDFARLSERFTHEAQIVAALAAWIQQSEYPRADERDYRAAAQRMEAQAVVAAQAAAEKNLPQARAAVAEISKSCSKCHEKYRD